MRGIIALLILFGFLGTLAGRQIPDPHETKDASGLPLEPMLAVLALRLISPGGADYLSYWRDSHG